MEREIDVVAAFKTSAGAARAVDRLEAAGFQRPQISVITNSDVDGQFATIVDGTKGAEGVAVGGVTGGALGAILAGVAGAAATVAIPGLGLVVAGPLVAALVGGGAGAIAGGVAGGLIGVGVSDHEAKLYEETMRAGGVVVAIRVRGVEDAANARKTLEAAGALQLQSEQGHAVAS